MADRYLKRALFLDLELTCWDEAPPEGMQPEIIQFSVVELDLDTLVIRRGLDRIVKPVTSTVSAFCTDLTGITPEKAKAGRPFREVARSSIKAFGERPWFSWGDDCTALREAARLRNCDMPLQGPYADLSGIFYGLLGTERRTGLDDAVARVGLDFLGRQHDALHDAVNTARIYAAVAAKLRGIEYGPRDFALDPKVLI